MSEHLPDPALVVLVGPAGSGKSHLGRAHYRGDEIVSSDDLRGRRRQRRPRPRRDRRGVRRARAHRRRPPRARADHRRRHPRTRRGRRRRAGWTRPGPPGCPPSSSLVDTPPAECRRRNADRANVVPAAALATQLQALRRGPRRARRRGLGRRPRRHARRPPRTEAEPDAAAAPTADRRSSQGLEVVLQLSPLPVGRGARRLAAGDGPGGRRGRVRRARGDGPPDPDPAGRPGLGADPRAVGDPRRWSPASDTGLRLGTLVTPVTFRAAGHHRQGRGDPRRADRRPRLRRRRRRLVGARARGVRPAVPARPRAARRARGRHRDDAGAVGAGHQGVRRRAGQRCRRRPATRGRSATIPVIVGGSGERRTLRDRGPARRRLQRARRRSTCWTASWRCCARTSTPWAGRTTTSRSPCSTCPSSGRDRDDVWARVERLRGRTPAAAYAAQEARRHRRRSSATAGPASPSAASTRCSCRTPDLDGPDDVLALAGLTDVVELATVRRRGVPARDGSPSSTGATSARCSTARGPGGPRSAAGSAGCPRRCRGSWSRGPTSRAARSRRSRRCRTARRTRA